MNRRVPPALQELDLQVLRFAAAQRLFLAGHVQGLLACSAASARGRLARLLARGLLERHRVFHGEPAAYTATRLGLGLVESTLAPARLDLSVYAHDIGVAWTWLAAQRGAFGELAEVISERQMRSRETVLREEPARDPRERLAVRLGGVGPGGRERLHYPDLSLLTKDGRRIAVEVEMSAKGRRRRDGILLGYAADSRIDAVLYLVDRADVARAVEASARTAGIANLVHVQPFSWGGAVPGRGGRSAVRARDASERGAVSPRPGTGPAGTRCAAGAGPPSREGRW